LFAVAISTHNGSRSKKGNSGCRNIHNYLIKAVFLQIINVDLIYLIYCRRLKRSDKRTAAYRVGARRRHFFQASVCRLLKSSWCDVGLLTSQRIATPTGIGLLRLRDTLVRTGQFINCIIDTKLRASTLSYPWGTKIGHSVLLLAFYQRRIYAILRLIAAKRCHMTGNVRNSKKAGKTVVTTTVLW